MKIIHLDIRNLVTMIKGKYLNPYISIIRDKKLIILKKKSVQFNINQNCNQNILNLIKKACQNNKVYSLYAKQLSRIMKKINLLMKKMMINIYTKRRITVLLAQLLILEILSSKKMHQELLKEQKTC